MGESTSDAGVRRLDLADIGEDLRIRGYSVLRAESTEESLTATATCIGGAHGAKSIGMMALEGDGSQTWLPRHTESLTHTEDKLLRYIGLGCLVASVGGGATCLYDGRVAARALAEELPGLLHVNIHYWSTVYPHQKATHPLICEDPDYGRVLRYRSAVRTNTVLGPLPDGLTEEEMYIAAEKAIGAALTLVHVWRLTRGQQPHHAALPEGHCPPNCAPTAR